MKTPFEAPSLASGGLVSVPHDPQLSDLLWRQLGRSRTWGFSVPLGEEGLLQTL